MASSGFRFEIPELEDIDYGAWRQIRPYQFEPRRSGEPRAQTTELQSDESSSSESETSEQLSVEPNRERIGNTDW